MFKEIHKCFCFGTCIISILFNIILLYISHKRKGRIGFYRYFTSVFVLFDMMYSIVIATIQPFWFACPGMLGFFSIASWGNNVTLIRLAYQFWIVLFILVLSCVCCSFIYRYGLLCRRTNSLYSRIQHLLSPRMVSLFEVPQLFAGTMLFLVVIIIGWMLDVNLLILINDSRAIRMILQDKFASDYNINFLKCYVLTVDINDKEYTHFITAGVIIFLVMMQWQILTIVFCGYSIQKEIKAGAISDKLKQIHTRALNMIISQAVNPLFFLYIPAFINMCGMFTDADFGDLPKVLAMVLALFPIFNPIIVVYFTDDYKRFLLNKGETSWNQVPAIMTKIIESRRERAENGK